MPEQRRDEPDPAGRRPRGEQPRGRGYEDSRAGYDDPRGGYDDHRSGHGQQGYPQGGHPRQGPPPGQYGPPPGYGPQGYQQPGDPRGRPPQGQGQGHGRPQSRAFDGPTDEVPRVPRALRKPAGSPPPPPQARPSGRASVGTPPPGRGPAVYGTPSPQNTGNVYGGAPAERDTGNVYGGAEQRQGRTYGGGQPPVDAPMSAPPAGRGAYPDAPMSAPPNAPMSAPPNAPMSAPPNAPMSAPPAAYPNAPMSAPPAAYPDAPMSAPPAGRHGGGDDAPVSAAPFSAWSQTEAPAEAPVSSAPVSSAPVSAAPVSAAPAAEPPPEVEPPAVQQGTAMGGYRSAPLTGAGVDGLQATGYLPIVRPGADGFPPELAAIAPQSPPGPRAEPAQPSAPDPEQVLASFVWRFDPDTLREQIEGDEEQQLTDIRDQLTAKLNGVADNPTRARLLSLRAVVSRILGDLPKAFADGKLALAHAEATGELRRIAIAQARLAHVLQWREEFEEADRLFTLANSSELPDRLRATMHQHAGKCAYDQGRYMEACNHFERALDLRKEEDPELIAQTELALDAVFRRVAEKGWGPYPRTREETLQIRKPPSPAFDEQTQRWGYIDPEGNFVIGPGYLDVQPFRDGVSWVQRQGSESWELIDDNGRVLIEPTAGYLGVGSFSDGVAWVSRDGTTRWIAIDKTNAVLISTGYDDVRPFRRGVAAVRRGRHWGAVDGVGRVVVSFQYDGFATALLDGRYIDGFSDEGLAVVSLDGRKGVVDRSGRVLVPPIHHTLMIHPVAFLIADDSQRWGALDRRGRTVIEATFASRTGVTDEIDRLLADTRPVM
ncbi:WG repeat-containing protein [Dactylosporangium sp. AC04546]|uniref:WG repeat-containing protein n=1 Tax=Dactylosporangium sp. AC04546 TaxID=2862460 RepID=UPI002E7BE085|nr:WG repeat-containing protein [Dactylosporangium sp. AC04546]WVK82236.1 WG repeat-containing protein [Dactylosporangium sp. AC04546]